MINNPLASFVAHAFETPDGQDAPALRGGMTPAGRYLVCPEDYLAGCDDGRWLSSSVVVDVEEVA